MAHYASSISKRMATQGKHAPAARSVATALLIAFNVIVYNILVNNLLRKMLRLEKIT